MQRLMIVPVLILALFLAMAVAGCGKKHIDPGPGTYDSPARRTQPPAPAPGLDKDGPAPKGTFKPYTIKGETYRPLRTGHGYAEQGRASWYGPNFHGKTTANGETYDMHAMTCAHRILPMNTRLEVTNLDNGQKAVLRVNDRGPFAHGRILDVSYAGAKALGLVGPGTARVRIKAVDGRRSASEVERLVATGRYFVQVGAFSQKQNARLLMEKLVSEGYGHSRMRHAQVGGAYYWRVQAGAFKGMQSAREARAGLQKRFPKAFIIAD